jgi:hypothetical protein
MKKRPRSVSHAVAIALIAGLLGVTTTAGVATAARCELNSSAGNIEHVISIIFDNTHFLRDDPNVPSDLEQMPHLLNFIKDNGTLLTNDHTILISHTAGGILTYLTGMYPDRHGLSVTNSYRYFKADGTTASSSAFKYWTDLVDDTGIPPADPLPNMVTGDSGIPKNTPAPWVPYTRAGCDFGAVALANVVLENTGTGPNGDMTKVFGAGSPEWNEAVASNAAPPGTPERQLAQTDFVGIDVHCAAGGGICTGDTNARPDILPDEPGGYAGFQGLFGAKYVNPSITGGSAVVNDLDGHPIGDQFGQPGFPGFDGLFASTTLAYVAQMQENGIPVTYGYISDAHDSHGVAGEVHIARGPGETPYVDQLASYDRAFRKFFDRLAADGITKDNTLFLFTEEEGDHFVGSSPSPAGCDGVNRACTYDQIGEINMNLAGQLATQQGITTPFTVHADMAPTIYITGRPGRTEPVTRDFARALGRLTAVSPYAPGTTDDVTVALADPVEMRALHMITADQQRTPTLTMFADPDYFLFAGAPNCSLPCVFVPPPSNFTFAWNHGSIDPEIATTWLGMVGPGVLNLGQNDTTWVDHTDVRPTTLSLVGLEDSYIHDGRVIFEVLSRGAVSPAFSVRTQKLGRLADVYKDLNAPFGQFSLDTLVASTRALESGDETEDSTYSSIENEISSLTSQREAVAVQMRAILEDVAFRDKPVESSQVTSLVNQALRILKQAHALAMG